MEISTQSFQRNFETNGFQLNRVPLKVLVVDDSPSMRMQLVWILGSVGYEVCEAANV